MDSFLKKLKIAIAVGTLLAIVLTSNFSSFAAVCDAIREDTLRFHVLANSDSEADQALKLKVRDAVLKVTAADFEKANTKQEAEKAADAQLDKIRAAAEKTIRSEGYDYSVKVYRTRMYFATTRYPRAAGGSYTLPAGQYDAVRIEIGAAAGHNWFCVLFPQLCLPAAQSDATADALYTDEEKQVLESGYEVRFALVEWLSKGEKKDAEPEPTPTPTPTATPKAQLMEQAQNSKKR